MKITLKKIKLLNFKGVGNKEINFIDGITEISGANATGKTTIMDAFLWLLFGKDSTDRKDFEIKTLGPANEHFHRMDHEVFAVLDIDDQEISLKRTYREKWVKKRGETVAEFSGHETVFEYDSIPMQEKEYKEKIALILEESLFKMVTNAGYFNGLKWEVRRQVLLDIAGDISNSSVLNSITAVNKKFDYLHIVDALNQKKTIEEYKREIIGKKKTIKDELSNIPSRIDEANRSLPEKQDYTAFEKALAEINEQIALTDKSISDKSAANKSLQDARVLKQNDLYALKAKLQKMEHEAKQAASDQANKAKLQVQEIEAQIERLHKQIQALESGITEMDTKIKDLNKRIIEKREEFAKVNSEPIPEFTDCNCPLCGNEFKPEDLESKKTEFISNYNAKKSTRLASIRTEGVALANTLSELQTTLDASSKQHATAKDQLDDCIENQKYLMEDVDSASSHEQENYLAELDRKGYAEVNNSIMIMEQELSEPITIDDEDKQTLIQHLSGLHAEADKLKKSIALKDQEQRILTRIKELEASENEMANKLAELEGLEFGIESFERAKMDELEKRVNGRFSLVKFKLFEKQINGAEVPACVTLINGVPYSDANNASKINAGLDIINTLSDHYKVFAPVFVDNAEAVNKLIDVESQLIKLVVTNDKALKVTGLHAVQFETA